jgi:hypothetical protein
MASGTTIFSYRFRTSSLGDTQIISKIERQYHMAVHMSRARARDVSRVSQCGAVTMLKACGVSDVLAREIVGHESAAVSRQYTHLTTEDLRSAMQKLPDVTA